MSPIQLSVNIDHVATLRNARGGSEPCPYEAARVAIAAGADGITLHLREDRRHIRDADARRIREGIAAPLNFEMAATEEMVGICLALAPQACCIVPERRAELTTEGGLAVAAAGAALPAAIVRLRAAGIRVHLFVEPDPAEIAAAAAAGASGVELHTGHFALADAPARRAMLPGIAASARHAVGLGLACHAGHGLTYESAAEIATIPEVTEVSIGHFLIAQALFEGLAGSVARMRRALDAGRGN